MLPRLLGIVHGWAGAGPTTSPGRALTFRLQHEARRGSVARRAGRCPRAAAPRGERQGRQAGNGGLPAPSARRGGRHGAAAKQIKLLTDGRLPCFEPLSSALFYPSAGVGAGRARSCRQHGSFHPGGAQGQGRGRGVPGAPPAQRATRALTLTPAQPSLLTLQSRLHQSGLILQANQKCSSLE